MKRTRTASAVFVPGCAVPHISWQTEHELTPCLAHNRLVVTFFERCETHVVNKHTRNLTIGFYVERSELFSGFLLECSFSCGDAWTIS